MSYNLGASSSKSHQGTHGAYDLTTPKGQMKYLHLEQQHGSSGTNLDADDVLDATVYGGLFQWGRGYEADRTKPEQDKVGWQHAVNFVVTDGLITSRTRRTGTGSANGAISYSGLTFDSNFQPTSTNDANILFITGASDWGDQHDGLWGNGRATNSYPTKNTGTGDISYGTTDPTGTPNVDFSYIDDGGNPYTSVISPNPAATRYYQQPVKTVNDPCPAGWRVPTQDEWETLGAYCDAHTAGGNFSVPSDGVGNPGANNPDLYWVAVVGGLVNASWSINSTASGYAIYNKADWLGADGLGINTGAQAYLAASENNRLYDEVPACPSPLLFLPTAGHRTTGGITVNVGNNASYWSSTVYSNPLTSYGHYFSFTTVYHGNYQYRAFGYSLRCVAEL
jgi:uncharacterized protein (TIGR02145 family)